jgi:nucleoid-associated protein YgaU
VAPTGAKLEKAHLIIVEPPPKGTKPPPLASVLSAPKANEGQITFQFNPKEYTVKKSAKWERKAAKGSKAAVMPEFMGPEPRALDLEMFLDKSESPKGDLVKDVEALFKCLRPTEKSQATKHPSPPWVIFGWGAQISIVAIVKSVSAKFTMFRPDGKPIRAVCTVSLEEVPTDPPPKQNPTSGGLAAIRTHRMVAGDSLTSVAYAEYDDAGLWRALADVNGIDDPFRVAAGTSLRIPSPAEAAGYR